MMFQVGFALFLVFSLRYHFPSLDATTKKCQLKEGLNSKYIDISKKIGKLHNEAFIHTFEESVSSPLISFCCALSFKTRTSSSLSRISDSNSSMRLFRFLSSDNALKSQLPTKISTVLLTNR